MIGTMVAYIPVNTQSNLFENPYYQLYICDNIGKIIISTYRNINVIEFGFNRLYFDG